MKPLHKKMSPERSRAFPGFDFSGTLIAWQKRYGRHTLPWQQTKDPYRIWLSEIMLQQTQVATVVPYYVRFLAQFPNVRHLALASPDAVMGAWSGLGYYSRARNLHRCARMVVEQYGGIFPSGAALLEKLPGIGRTTAAAISVFSAGTRAAILDGNVIRVLSRVFGMTARPDNKKAKEKWWHLAESLLPFSELESYTQGLMDLGSAVCVRSRPLCRDCPFSPHCVALLENRVKELPTKKRQKILPEKEVTMLILVHENKVLLQRRPASGIWGGLLSLPELTLATKDITDIALEDAVRPFGRMLSFQLLERFSHTFTHFRLWITPVFAMSSGEKLSPPDLSCVWYSLKKVETAPLPAPVKKLLGKTKDRLQQAS